jgi:hypothetical protein
MSAPTRIITPRLEAAITAQAELGDKVISLASEAVLFAPMEAVPGWLRDLLNEAMSCRAELLEALEEANG